MQLSQTMVAWYRTAYFSNPYNIKGRGPSFLALLNDRIRLFQNT